MLKKYKEVAKGDRKKENSLFVIFLHFNGILDMAPVFDFAVRSKNETNKVNISKK